ncbi:MAG: hypothetical protein LBO03_00100 [Acidaminococcales bacterium]|jgi:hypothetical protein|nr:hypothetical protein [Acidaminococcales bacterium]
MGIFRAFQVRRFPKHYGFNMESGFLSGNLLVRHTTLFMIMLLLHQSNMEYFIKKQYNWKHGKRIETQRKAVEPKAQLPNPHEHKQTSKPAQRSGA